MPASEVTQPPCPDCGGSGWVISPDGGAGAALPCECRKVSRASRLLAGAGIPERYAHCDLASFLVSSPHPREGDQLLNARRDAQAYVDDFITPSGRFRDSGLLFIGPPGVGKTHLAVAVLKELVQRYGVRGRFAEFSSILHHIQSTFDPGSPESKQSVLDPLTEAEVLVLDELGAQQATPWVRDMLYLIVNQRYLRRLPTIFTTNYRLSGRPLGKVAPTRLEKLDRGRDPEPTSPIEPPAQLLTSRIPTSLVSRLYEMAQPVLLLDVSDYRIETKHQRHKVRAAR